jgi:hypothetical protein
MLHFGFYGVFHFFSLVILLCTITLYTWHINSVRYLSSHLASNLRPTFLILQPYALHHATPAYPLHPTFTQYTRIVSSAKPIIQPTAYPKRTMLCPSNQHLSLILPVTVINPNPILRNLYAPQVSAGFSYAPTSACINTLFEIGKRDLVRTIVCFETSGRMWMVVRD